MKALLLIKIWTSVYASFYLPIDRDATVSVDIGKTHCVAKNQFKQKKFSLDCQKNLKRVIYFEDRTPEIKSTIVSNDIIIKIGNE